MSKKDYKTLTVGSIWVGESKAGNSYVSVPVVQEVDDKGKPNKYCKIKLYAEVIETGKVFTVKQFKTFMSDRHENLLADLCVELNDEEYSVEVK